MQLRPYQIDFKQGIYAAWSRGQYSVLGVLPTGAGKTVSFSDIVRENPGASCVIAHRQELVTQISMSLARAGVVHRIISPANVRRGIETQHRREFKRTFYDAGAKVGVAGVDTLVRKTKQQLSGWAEQVTLWVQDEAHHVLEDNKWGKVIHLFPNARGLGVTATPLRADGKGLGRGQGGVFDELVVGPSMAELLELGYLAPYRIFAPPSDIDLTDLKITGSGDVSTSQLKQRVAKSRIVGDVVEHYLRLAPGKLGVTFVESLDTARLMVDKFRAGGVPAEMISANTPSNVRTEIIRRFKDRKVLQLVNVDIIGEGLDIPVLEVISMVRYTESYGLFVQQFGRPLRPVIPPAQAELWSWMTPQERGAFISEGSKPHAIIIDHVGNCVRHGVPNHGKDWSLGKRERKKSTIGEIQIKSCLNPVCLRVYEAYKVACPYCGDVPVPAARTAPEHVAGDLVELDPDTLKEMARAVAKVDGAVLMPNGLSHLAMGGVRNKHLARQQEQAKLRAEMTWWAGGHRMLGLSTRETQKLFYLRFGVDVMSAQALGGADLRDLKARVDADIEKLFSKNNLIRG